MHHTAKRRAVCNLTTSSRLPAVWTARIAASVSRAAQEWDEQVFGDGRGEKRQTSDQWQVQRS